MLWGNPCSFIGYAVRGETRHERKNMKILKYTRAQNPHYNLVSRPIGKPLDGRSSQPTYLQLLHRIENSPLRAEIYFCAHNSQYFWRYRAPLSVYHSVLHPTNAPYVGNGAAMSPYRPPIVSVGRTISKVVGACMYRQQAEYTLATRPAFQI